ncbi:MAG: C45 family peptidase [Candidatus Tantalella remota]|nr:C45 family peptidase [Candidatus Tantalella remota]
MRKNIIKLALISVVIALIAQPGYARGGRKLDVKDEIVLKKGPGTYMQVRHITIKGTNEEIGKALADIARKGYDTKLVKYADPVYAKARLEYMKKNYPFMHDRMKGVAKSYGVSLDDTDLDTSALYYWRLAPECSAIFFPADVSADGHDFFVSNRDYYTASMSEVMGKKRKPGEEDFSSRVFVVELYPDKGYSSIGVGFLDLMSINIDGINSAGLAVAMLEDDTFGIDHSSKDLSRMSGLYIYQTIRLILDTCATVEEAKIAILTNDITMALLPAHFMVIDATGKSFVYERSSKDFTDRIIGSVPGKPVPITNHSLYDYPTVDKFPKAGADDYDTFNRYRRLEKYLLSHSGKYSVKDGQEAMSLVYGRVEEASEGGHHDLPLRTLYTAVCDINDRSIAVRFYLRDGKADPETGLAALLFSEPIEFKLKPGRKR